MKKIALLLVLSIISACGSAEGPGVPSKPTIEDSVLQTVVERVEALQPILEAPTVVAADIETLAKNSDSLAGHTAVTESPVPDVKGNPVLVTSLEVLAQSHPDTVEIVLSVAGVEDFGGGFTSWMIYEVQVPDGYEIVKMNPYDGIGGRSAYPFVSHCKIANARCGGFGSSKNPITESGELVVFTLVGRGAGEVVLDQFFISNHLNGAAHRLPMTPERVAIDI